MRNILKIELNPGRIFGLDLLRALAILFVCVDHSTDFLPENLKVINKIFRFDGISVFFVLSGFLIGGILIKLLEGDKPNTAKLLHFWKRRWFRTLPNYFLILIILVLLEILFNMDAFSFQNTIPYFVFSQNLFQPHPWFFPEAWSLSIEEWFYLIVPALIVLGIRILRLPLQKSILYSAVFIILMVLGFRYYKYVNQPFEDILYWDLNFRKQVSTRFDSLMFGILGAYLQFYHFKNWIKYKKTLLFLGIIVLLGCRILQKIIPPYSIYSCVFSFVMISTGVLLLLPYLSELKTGKGMPYKMITYISLISYSMYLLNYSVVKIWVIDRVFNLFLPENTIIISFVKYGLFWSLTFILSILLYKYFEIPTTNLRDKKWRYT